MRHALPRTNLRNIDKAEIKTNIKNPEKIPKNAFGNSIAQKLFGNYLLRVVLLEEKDGKKIITAYKTTDLKRYL